VITVQYEPYSVLFKKNQIPFKLVALDQIHVYKEVILFMERTQTLYIALIKLNKTCWLHTIE